MICPGCEIWEENERLRAENAELREQNAELKMQNGKLKRRLVLYENVRGSSTKQRLPRRRRERTGVRFPGRPRGYPGSTWSIPKPDFVVEAEALSDCPECETPLGPPIYTKERIVEELPELQPMKVNAYKELHYFCSNCECEVVARHPDCPPEGRFGKTVYVQSTLLKFQQRLPLGKIRSVFEMQGLEISSPTLLELLRRTSEWLRPDYERILMSIRGSRVVYTDQTGMGVDGANFWIWVFTTDSKTLFTIRNSKSQKVLEGILGKGWNGTLVCDGLRSHHSFARNNGAKIQRCWAHLLKEARELSEKYAEAKALDEGLHRIFDRLKKALEREPPPEERERLARNAMRAMRRLMDKRYSSSRVRKFVEKMRRGYPSWFTFVTVPGVEPTNNRAERALRELVVHRKIIGTLRNQKGVQIYETLPTLLATWRQRGLNLQEALSDALTEVWQRVRKNGRS
jgi:transposase